LRLGMLTFDGGMEDAEPAPVEIVVDRREVVHVEHHRVRRPLRGHRAAGDSPAHRPPQPLPDPQENPSRAPGPRGTEYDYATTATGSPGDLARVLREERGRGESEREKAERETRSRRDDDRSGSESVIRSTFRTTL
jgi:hypothetical protein